ncbi:hypothetical protein CCAX7_62260 [Capsulimonas corticalis]|uniref:Uncharacterized protein n=1 Tax=Capsulimonas corticalis TaxID=2219043 RepID=A0A402CWK0_9BACT|nr:hypothetical protein [Capsulimonas corticalis]BDI34175.1 hypothetical protein CCAX7_62260 [Capsulimonas corticalis]
MTDDSRYSDIRILTQIDQRTLDEMSTRGFLGPLLISIDDSIYSLFFITPERIKSELKASLDSGEIWFSEPGLIVIPDITMKNIETALEDMCRQKFFDCIKPIENI